MRIHEVHQITKKDERELVDDFRRIVDSIALGIRDQQAHDDEELARADLEVKARAEATALGLDYTSGNEDKPEFDITPCPKDACTYERIANMKAKWVPSVHSASQYPEVKAFFDQKGIQTAGYLIW